MLDDHHGERPEGVEGDGEGPAGEEMIRPTRPLLVLLQILCENFDETGGGVDDDIDCNDYATEIRSENVFTLW